MKTLRISLIFAGASLCAGGFSCAQNQGGATEGANGNKTASAAASTSCANAAFCYTYLATGPGGAGYTGSLSGISGADQKCANDKPANLTGTYKALIVDATNRTFLPTKTDWVLYANKQYRRSDGTTDTFMTDANAMVSVDLSQQIEAGANTLYWNGLGASTWATGQTCTNWSTTAGNGQYGQTAVTIANQGGAGAFTTLGQACTTRMNLLCVQQ